MSLSTGAAILKALLTLAVYFAQRAQRSDIEEAMKNALENLQGKRVDAAVAARDDVLSGRVQPDDGDVNRRD
jgi:hypothetical protein